MSDRPALPHNADAERVVLGASIISPAAFESAQALAVADFYLSRHRHIFEALGVLAATGKPIDLVAVHDQLARAGALKEAGGPAYVGALVDGVPHMTGVDQWVRIIKDKARLRRLAQFGNALARDAAADTHEPSELVDEGVAALLAEADQGTGWCDNSQLVKAAVREIEDQAATRDGVLGLRTGLIDLDERLQGIRAGTFGVIGARLGQGKSTLALQVAEAVAATEEGRVVFFSLEMGGVALMKRRLASNGMVSINRLYRAEAPDVREQRWARIARAAKDCARPDLMLNTGCRTVAQIRAASRQIQAKHGLALVVVDYLQLIGTTRKRERRSLEIADVSGDLLQMAHALNVPVIAVSQLNRESEARPDHRPTMADLADGDSIGRDCDWCVLIQRDIKPPKGGDEVLYRNMAYLWLAKHREGASGKVEVRWNQVLARFENLAHEQREGVA